MADGSPEPLCESGSRPHSFHMDPKLAPTPDMMHLQIASLKKEIERQRTAHEGNLEPCLSPVGIPNKVCTCVCLSFREMMGPYLSQMTEHFKLRRRNSMSGSVRRSVGPSVPRLNEKSQNMFRNHLKSHLIHRLISSSKYSSA